MTILVTNDDGIHGPGLLALCRALSRDHEVWAVVPERQRSAASHSITLHKPLAVHPRHLLDNVTCYACSGTPSDCITLGLVALMPEQPDLILSGINDGRNVGCDVTYSGTVMAALEGCLANIPSAAISQERSQPTHVDTAAQFAVLFCQSLANFPLPPGVFLNINLPSLPLEQVKGVQITRLSRLVYYDQITRTQDPRGRIWYWRGGSPGGQPPEEGTDAHALAAGFISITPISPEMTSLSSVPALAEWAKQLDGKLR